MRDFSKVSLSVWRSRKFRSLRRDDQAKLAYFYLLTTPHGNAAGCFDLDPVYACADLEWTDDIFAKAIDRLAKASLVSIDRLENSILISNWCRFNPPTNPKHAMGILDELKKASSVLLKRQRLQEYTEVFAEKGYGNDKALKGRISDIQKACSAPPMDAPEHDENRKPMDSLSSGYRQTEVDTERELEGETDLESERDSEVDQEARDAQSAPGVRALNGATPSPHSVKPTALAALENLERRRGLR